MAPISIGFHSLTDLYAVRTPKCTHLGLGSSDFARHYFRNHGCFLFLRLLRCFSSAGSLRTVMYWLYGTRGLLQWVSPFRYLRINSYLPIPAAFRSLSRLSSALSAQAFTLCSYCLTNSPLVTKCRDTSVYLFSDCEEDFSSYSRLFVQVLPCTLGCLTLFTRIIISFLICSFQGTMLTFVSSTMGSHEPPVLLAALYFILFYFQKNVWHPPIFPCRYQQSIFGRLSLNRRVRDGNGCFP